MKTLEDRLRELAAGADSVFLNPITVDGLRNQGIDIPEPRRLSPACTGRLKERRHETKKLRNGFAPAWLSCLAIKVQSTREDRSVAVIREAPKNDLLFRLLRG